MKKKNISKNTLLVLFIILIICLGLIILVSKNANLKTSSRDNSNISNQRNVFESKYLNFSINLPIGYQAKEETTRITINSNNGQIYVTRNGTQFNDLVSYLDDFDTQTNLNAINENKYSVNGSEAVSRIFEKTDVSGGQEKLYFIYVDNLVYKFSTTSEPLFDDLDQIAKSFRYMGE